MIELYRIEAVNDKMLKYTTGIKFYTHKGYQNYLDLQQNTFLAKPLDMPILYSKHINFNQII